MRSSLMPTTAEEHRIPLSRSPHPYHRRKLHVDNATSETNVSSPALTPSPSDLDLRANQDSNQNSRARLTRSASDSGTEADDEALILARALPPSLTNIRKGLKSDWVDWNPPILSAAAATPSTHVPCVPIKSEGQQRVKQRNQELLRRISEIVFSAILAGVLFGNPEIWSAIVGYCRGELFVHVGVVAVLSLVFVTRHLTRSPSPSPTAVTQAIHFPTSFDPAPFLYPTFLPILVCLALAPSMPEIILPNIVLSLSSLPGHVIPMFGQHGQHFYVHWMITLIPVCLSTKGEDSLASLYPLHNALSQLLYYLTTTSLLSSELYLLSTSLINILLFSTSPPSIILSCIIWVGGLGLFSFCMLPMRWNVALERIPSWRLYKQKKTIPDGTTSTAKSIAFSKQSDADEASSDEVSEAEQVSRMVANNTNAAVLPSLDKISPRLPVSTRRRSSLPGIEDVHREDDVDHAATGAAISIRPLIRSHTMPTRSGISNALRRKRRLSTSTQAYLSMTSAQIEARKWLYAGFTFFTVFALILCAIRPLIAKSALDGYEPFGWAVGYLFGDLNIIRSVVYGWSLQDWIVLSDNIHKVRLESNNSGWIEGVRQQTVGAANTRLLLFTYWLIVVSLGILTVLRLSAFADVDTRRKVFHGMMVIMLLPSTYLDPEFLSLGLVLVLAVFLLLDLFRAAQLRPISKPLAKFLTPYIDGRDLQGPVVVSHIFLLVGCAIPLWLSLAGVEREGDAPWQGWEVATRDVSMVAGVVCVGMGDAAASLVGRRIGRHKWPWPGGKSFEGSAAFAVAVTVGLLFGKAWLRMGGWRSLYDDDDDSWLTILVKASMAACGASFTEAVLTGCNDNVVVPVVLWLLAKALRV